MESGAEIPHHEIRIGGDGVAQPTSKSSNPKTDSELAVAALAVLPRMRFRWEWLQSVVQAPYVPPLGPESPDVLYADLLNAAHDIDHAGHFLPFITR
jgi:hypothetical protein